WPMSIFRGRIPGRRVSYFGQLHPFAAAEKPILFLKRTGQKFGQKRRRISMTPLEGLQAAMAGVDALFKERGIFEGGVDFGQGPPLVVIDMAYGWTDAAYAGGSARLDGAVAAIQKLLPAARTKQVPIFYTTSPFREKPHFKSAADFSPGFRKWDRR